MVRFLLIVLFSIFSFGAIAQNTDSLFAVHKGANWAIKYVVKPGETVHMLAIRFFITDGVIINANEPDVIKRFAPGSSIYIPVTPENYFVSKQTFKDANDLYYHVLPKDDIGLLSTYAGITKNQMRLWNSLHGNTLTPDEVLFVGWVKMLGYDSSSPTSEVAYPSLVKKAMADSVKSHVYTGGLDTAYNKQTENGTNVLTERGTVVFFEKGGRNKIFYAFHNATPRGSIIKVFNPGTDRTVYVKVLGPIPGTKLYANSIIGICAAAKEALGVTDNKAWCELTYSAN